ncbi:Hypothetical protein PP7435_CHR3-0672 [Komagataella phaffii CBS 7435]|uniref:Rrn9 domain-containing protein n=2 Tax=Komagataella phaffii TaxID=460519 RepID=C4R4U6_KOMPG|nr:Hypothetical protein PAS_chr3_0533 [Komagataella phaffii GS115]AOA63502.1 GQ67_03606T0 [Komagataella phaffii]CAH2449656.1 Hypothetical protein BQ9382_C3-3575 [Komagataella phaffii CBS 7435]AOA68275.1 GQ68_03577T0 [Komagataella phaffii GS115]CAY70582.1 Hypothetical protein PAS_chr3_0533 [Komagataella phaffii GS115]CCA39629.1 Hypothetical protein PP7435_CHR3-0672 [Komagataella phaffii CBS 7435]
MSSSEEEEDTPMTALSEKKLRREGQKLLRYFEDTQAQDLGIHLYSAFLLSKQTNGLLPRKRWHAWPLAIDKVSDPKFFDRYVDENEPYHIRRWSGTRHQPIPLTVSKSEHPSETIASKPGSTFYKERQVSEFLTDPLQILKEEINAAFQRKLNQKIHISKTKHYQPVIGSETNIPEILINKILARLHHILIQLAVGRGQTPVSASEFLSIKRSGLLDWMDVLMACREDSPRVHKLFDLDSSDAKKIARRDLFELYRPPVRSRPRNAVVDEENESEQEEINNMGDPSCVRRVKIMNLKRELLAQKPDFGY